MRSEVDPGQYWHTLRRRKWWVLGSILLGALLAVGLNTFTTPVYRAITRVEIKRPQPRTFLTGDVIEQSTSQSENLALFTTAELITNRVLLGDVVRELEATNVPLRDADRVNPLRALAAKPVWARLRGETTDHEAVRKTDVDWLLSHISVEPVKDTRLVNIVVEHWSPNAAEQIANTVARAFAAHHARQASSGSNSLVAYLTGQLTQTREEIEQREAQLAGTGANSPAGLAARREQVSQGVGEMRRELLRVETELARAREIYKDQHPKIVVLESQRESIQQSLDSDEQELAGLNSRIQRNGSVEEDLRGRRQFYELLETKLRDAQITGQMLNPLIQIVEPATASQNPVRPRKALNFGLCLLAGFTVGTGLAFMREGLNRTIRTPQDVSEHLQLPVLGLIRKGL